MNDNGVVQPQAVEDVFAEAKANSEVEAAKDKEGELTEAVLSPGWEAVKDKLDARSSDTAICERLRPLITDAKITNEQLGELTRVAFMVGKEIQDAVIDVVETAKVNDKK